MHRLRVIIDTEAVAMKTHQQPCEQAIGYLGTIPIAQLHHLVIATFGGCDFGIKRSDRSLWRRGIE